MKIRQVLFLILSMFLTIPAFATEYEIDPAHSAVSFKVRHLLSYVNGSFDQFEGRFKYVADKPEEWSVEATIKTDSVNTKHEQRDNHLKNADFFDVINFPVMTFKSTQVTDYSKGKAKLHGILSLHGVEKPVVLDLQVFGVDRDPWGNDLAGFSASTVINRKDFGLVWNQVAESGKLLVGDEVYISIDVEGITVVAEPNDAAAE